MNRFVQLHLLSFFPPANLNRDDTGRPKTAVVGGSTRLRISSQALKRAWRTSEIFTTALDGHIGQRTQRLGEALRSYLAERGMQPTIAVERAREIAGRFGKLKEISKDQPMQAQIEQLAFISPDERAAAFALADKALTGEKLEIETADLLRRTDTAADIALFGRMLADEPDYNREAAAQVAHAITTHRVTVEDDFYTAVDDLKTRADDAGAGFLGEAAFGSGVFYQYLCIDRALLLKNLAGDAGLATTTIAALTEAAATVAPRGKQNSFAAHGRAHYLLAELGPQQPRTLAGAFIKSVSGDDLMAASVAQLRTFRDRLAAAYGSPADAACEMVVGGDGSLHQVLAFIRDAAW